MVIDAHTHLFPEEVRKNRKAFCCRDEGFRLIYGREKARMAGLQDLLQAMDRDGVDSSVVCGFPWKDPGLCREGNDYLFHCSRQYPDRIIPFLPVFLSGPCARPKRNWIAAFRWEYGASEKWLSTGEKFPSWTLQRLASMGRPFSG